MLAAAPCVPNVNPARAGKNSKDGPMPAPSFHIDYLLRLADDALVLGQRLAEWCGHGPCWKRTSR